MKVTKLPKDREECAMQVRQITQEFLAVDRDKLTDSASFSVDLGADSLDFIELVMELEEAYGIMLLEEEANESMTFSALVDIVYKHLKDGGVKS